MDKAEIKYDVFCSWWLSSGVALERLHSLSFCVFGISALQLQKMGWSYAYCKCIAKLYS